MPRPSPPSASVVLTFLRTARGWSQKDLAQAVGTAGALVSAYETGRKSLSRQKLESLVAAMGLSSDAIETALLCLESVRTVHPEAVAAGPVAPTGAERRKIEAAAAKVARAAAQVTRARLTSRSMQARARQARREAEELWARLKPYSAQDRRVLVEAAPEYQGWALCERVCAASIKAAAADANRALELAGLALQIAALTPVGESWRSRLQGYAWAHLGNARRVASDLPGAHAAFVQAHKLWQAGAPADPSPLDEARILDLEASLRRDQRLFPEALKLHDRALAASRPESSGALFLNKATTLEQVGNHELAIEILRRATPLVDPSRQPRLFFALRFNLLVNLCHAGQHGVAEPMVGEVRDLAVQLGNEPDLLRVLWLQARVAAGLGRSDEAIAAMEQVRRDFAGRRNSYDTALSTLELAILLCEQGKAARVQALAEDIAPIFQAQGVQRETLATLEIFCEAAESRALTSELARQLVDRLRRARHNPTPRSEAAG
jgi:transcriptional regulator with XRE-family HTH domain